MIVLDTSLFTDYLILFEEDRHHKARELFSQVSEHDFIIYGTFFIRS
jgi:predicted nucleic acid-binding protein